MTTRFQKKKKKKKKKKIIIMCLKIIWFQLVQDN